LEVVDVSRRSSHCGVDCRCVVRVPTRAGIPANVINIWDTDHDGTLDLNEINKAAEAEFDKLDIDHDGTLDMKELGRRLTRAEFLAADKDKDGTLDKAEYMSIVAKRFRAANRDNDTTIDTKELHTAAGRRLETLLR
jgi:Ca2+-binding EF-hand superfamily protein